MPQPIYPKVIVRLVGPVTDRELVEHRIFNACALGLGLAGGNTIYQELIRTPGTVQDLLAATAVYFTIDIIDVT